MNAPDSTALNADCIGYMRSCGYREFDLAVVDPPYYADPKKIIVPGGRVSTTGVVRTRYHMPEKWAVPDEEYFSELRRISRNQIVFGVNYFPCIAAWGTGRIVWDKGADNGTNFSDCEIAFCSIEKTVRIVRYRWNGMIVQEPRKKEKRIHPMQKPVALYRWLLEKYAKPGDRIFDSHLGSGSSRIAARLLGLDFVGCEIDRDYFNAQEKRFKDASGGEEIDLLLRSAPALWH